MREPSASHLALAKLCAFPFTSGIRWPWEEQGRPAMWGDRVHAGAEALVTRAAVYPALYAGLTDAEALALPRCVSGAAEFLDRAFGWAHGQQTGGAGGLEDPAVTPAGWALMPELALRYDVERGTAHVSDWHAKEPKRPGEWTAKADLVAHRGDGEIVVIDWKTGRQSWTDHAADNPQMQLGALAAARAFGASRVRVVLVYLDQDGFRVDEATFDRFDLARFAADFRHLRRSLTGGPTAPTPGMHCTTHYCKLAGICPATQSALATVQPVGERFSVEIRDEDHARWTLERLAGARKALEAVERALQEHARTSPVYLGDGKVYGWHDKERRSVKVDTAERLEAMRDALGAFADVAIETKTSASIEGIEEACRAAGEAAGEKRTTARRTRAALEALEARGVVERRTIPTCEIFKPKTKENEAAA